MQGEDFPVTEPREPETVPEAEVDGPEVAAPDTGAWRPVNTGTQAAAEPSDDRAEPADEPTLVHETLPEPAPEAVAEPVAEPAVIEPEPVAPHVEATDDEPTAVVEQPEVEAAPEPEPLVDRVESVDSEPVAVVPDEPAEGVADAPAESVADEPAEAVSADEPAIAAEGPDAAANEPTAVIEPEASGVVADEPAEVVTDEPTDEVVSEPAEAEPTDEVEPESTEGVADEPTEVVANEPTEVVATPEPTAVVPASEPTVVVPTSEPTAVVPTSEPTVVVPAPGLTDSATQRLPLGEEPQAGVPSDGIFRPASPTSGSSPEPTRFEPLSEEEQKLAAERAARREARTAALAAPAPVPLVAPAPVVVHKRTNDKFWGSLGLFLLRIVLAAIFAVRGLNILTDIPAAQAQFAKTIIPQPEIMAIVTGVAAELIALSLLLGLLTRVAGLGIALIAGGALAFVYWSPAWSPFVPGQSGFLGEYELLLAAVGVLLLLVGGGGWSLDRSFRAGRERDKQERASASA